MTKKNITKYNVFILVIILSGFSGCGDSTSDSTPTGDPTAAEVEAAYATILTAHVEKQTTLYRLIRIFSNDYQNGFMELELTDAQLEEAMDEIFRIEAIAEEALEAQEKLAVDPQGLNTLHRSGLLPQGKKATGVFGLDAREAFKKFSCDEFCKEVVGFSEGLRNTLVVNSKKMSDSQKEALWNSMDPSIKDRASSATDFFNKLNAGELDDDMGAINTSLNANEDYAVDTGMRPIDQVLNKARNLFPAGVKKLCSSFIDLGGGAPKILTKVSKEAVDAMAKEFEDYRGNKDTVTYKNVASDSPYASLPEDERLAQAVFDKLDGVKDVDGEDVDDEGAPVVREVEVHDAAWFVSQSMEIIGKVWGAVTSDVSSLVGMEEEQGMVVVSTPEDVDATEVEGFVALEPTVPRAGCPNLVMGFGAPVVETDPIWYGLLPEGEWTVMLQSFQGTESEAQMAELTAGTIASVEVELPPKIDEDEESSESSSEPAEEGSWFSWVDDLAEDGSGIPFVDDDDGEYGNSSSGGGTTVSCDLRTNDGSCVDYVGVNDASVSQLSMACDGTFSTSACDASDATFTCGITISSLADTYDVRTHYYFMGSVPQSTIEQTCESICRAYTANYNFTISNCSAL